MKSIWVVRCVTCYAVAAFLASCVGPRSEVPEPTSGQIERETRLQRIAYVREAYGEQKRLNRLSYRIGDGIKSLCGRWAASRTGAFFSDWDQRTSEWLDVARGALGVNLHEAGVEVIDIVPGSAADQAGLKVGDHVISVDSKRLPIGAGALKEFQRHLRAIYKKAPRPILFRVRREARFFDISVMPKRSCDFPILLMPGQEVNAMTDGFNIYVTRGAMRFVRNDDELAAVITHEVAHILMGHLEARAQNAVAGAAVGVILDVLILGAGVQTHGIFQDIGASIGAETFSVEFEKEADYVSVYLMAKAGFKYEIMPSIWRRMALYQKGIIAEEKVSTHPTSVQRFLLLDKTVQEVEKKMDRGQPIEPKLPPARQGSRQ